MSYAMWAREKTKFAQNEIEKYSKEEEEKRQREKEIAKEAFIENIPSLFDNKWRRDIDIAAEQGESSTFIKFYTILLKKNIDPGYYAAEMEATVEFFIGEGFQAHKDILYNIPKQIDILYNIPEGLGIGHEYTREVGVKVSW